MRAYLDAIPLTWDRAAEAAVVVGRAFQDYPLYRSVFPKESERHLRTPRAVDLLIRYALRYGEVFTTTNVQGAACWLPPDAPYLTTWRMLGLGLIMFPFRIGLAAAQRLQQIGTYLEAVRRRTLPGPHWYLMLLGVDPAHQGTGVGSMLVRPILARAQAAALPCYLETQVEVNVTIYRRLGFEVVHEADVPGTDCRSWAMIREAARH